MANGTQRPQRVKTQKADEQVILYDFHVDIEVKAPVLDEKRLLQLIDDRIRGLAATLKNHSR